MPVLTVEFNDRMNDILQELADKKGTTKVDIIRRAVALYKYISNELACRRKDDLVPKRLVIRNSEDVILKEVVVP
jgi:predicted transcriptional regulator